MKRSIPLLALILVLVACGEEPAPTPTTGPPQALVTYEGQGFAIDHPAGWAVVSEPGLVTFTAPEPVAGFTDNFNVSYGEVPDEQRAAYYQGELARLREFFGPIEVKEDVDVSVGGVPGRALTFTAVQGDTIIGISRLILQKDDVAYEITFFSTEQRLFELTRVVQDVLASFRFTP